MRSAAIAVLHEVEPVEQRLDLGLGLAAELAGLEHDRVGERVGAAPRSAALNRSSAAPRCGRSVSAAHAGCAPAAAAAASATAPTVKPVSNTTAPSAAGFRDTRAVPDGATNAPPMKLPSACTGEVHPRGSPGQVAAEVDRRGNLRDPGCWAQTSCGIKRPEMPSLVFLAGPIAGRRYKLGEGEYVIGRRSDCQIFVPDMRVSRQHARLWRPASGWTLEDLGSNNGTYVNGVRLQQSTPLKHDDEITIANNRIRVEATEADPSEPRHEGNLVTIVDVGVETR